MTPFLSRSALRRVVQSLLTGEMQALRGKQSTPGNTPALTEAWPDELNLGDGDGGSLALGCDSLEILHLSAAVNEMFHLYEVGLEARLLQAQALGSWLALIEEAWERGVDHITLTTSGSSGTPKRCRHPLRHLATEVDFLAALFHDRSRIFAAAPARHIYGLLFTALLPDRLGIPLLDLGSPSCAVSDRAHRTFQAGDLIVSSPNIWAWLDRSISRWDHGIAGVTSTAPCPRSTLDSLSGKGLEKMVEVYGATETAGVGVRVWPETSFRLMPQWVRQADPAMPTTLVSETSGVEVQPLDHLRFLDERRFLVEGRRDGAVQVGGTNVFLAQVEQRLVEHHEIKAAAVRLMRPEEGNRLKCFIVPTENGGSERVQQRIEAFVSTWLIPAERPKLFTFGSELPRNALGKLCDW